MAAQQADCALSLLQLLRPRCAVAHLERVAQIRLRRLRALHVRVLLVVALRRRSLVDACACCVHCAVCCGVRASRAAALGALGNQASCGERMRCQQSTRRHRHRLPIAAVAAAASAAARRPARVATRRPSCRPRRYCRCPRCRRACRRSPRRHRLLCRCRRSPPVAALDAVAELQLHSSVQLYGVALGAPGWCRDVVRACPSVVRRCCSARDVASAVLLVDAPRVRAQSATQAGTADARRACVRVSLRAERPGALHTVCAMPAQLDVA